MQINPQKITYTGLFIALGITVGYALISIPNVEGVTATIFTGGYLLGFKYGLIIGCFTEAIYSATNPYGMASPPLFLAQIISMTLVGGLGALVRKYQSRHFYIRILQFGTAGFISSLCFAVLTTLGFTLFMGFTSKTFITGFISGIGFYLIHILSNIILFLTLVPALCRILSQSIPGFKNET